MPDDKKKNETNNTYEMQSGIADNKNNIGFDKIEFLLDIPLEISVELGRTKLVISDLLKLAQGSIIELSKVAGETMDILANQRLIAKGEVVSVNEKYGVRLTEIISHKERLEKIR